MTVIAAVWVLIGLYVMWRRRKVGRVGSLVREFETAHVIGDGGMALSALLVLLMLTLHWPIVLLEEWGD